MKCYDSFVDFQNITVENMYIHSNLIIVIGTVINLENSYIANISRKVGTSGRIYSAITRSTASIVNTVFENIPFGIIMLTESQMNVTGVHIENVTSTENIIDWHTSYEITIDGLTTYNLLTKNFPSVINFRFSAVKLIKNCIFEMTQYAVMRFGSSSLAEYTNNTMNGINRGIIFISGSNGTITNSLFTNMVQNVKEGNVYISSITRSGAAIGRHIPF
jgi:hypothetical protein